VPLGSIKPGRYAFEVRARDEGLDIDATPARIAFTVTAIPWPQRAWFWPVVVALCTGFGFLGVSAVVERNRSRHRAATLERTVKERTSALGQSEARFRAMCAAAPIPMLICHEPDGVILYANRLLGETLGIAREQLRGRRFDDHFGDGREFHRLCQEVVADGTAFGHEILTKRADGSQLWSLASFQTMIYEGEPALIAGLHDITGQRQAAEELQRARHAAEAASRAKSVFLANVTHEVRTPIMAMLGAAEAAADTPPDGRQAVDHAEVIARNGRHLLALFDNLLELACLDAGKFAVRPVLCSLPEILADVGAIARPACDNPRVDFEILCGTAIPKQIHTDPVRLKQALINLINNALKFTASGYVRVLVRVDADKAEPRLSIAVEDTGPGIPDADLKRMFEPFEQAAPHSGQLVDGVGLGLPLARRIAEALGGAVGVESQVGKGSVFTLTAKTGLLQTVDWIQPAEINATLGRPETVREAGTSPTLSGSVLLAEDTADTRELIATAFRSRGVDVTAVENGRQAVEAASKMAFDLILMDIRMPVMDGVSATVELRKRGCLAPIIALTASVAKDDYLRILTKGFDDLWPKPISLERIVEQSSAYLDSPECDKRSRTSDTPASGLVSDGAARLGAIKAEFRRDLPNRVRSLRTAVENGDMEAARELLHKLAGTAGMMDIMPLSIEAARVLRETRPGNGSPADSFLEPIEALVHQITTSADGDTERASPP